MSRCIYCLKDIVPRDVAVGLLNPSLEHIIPYSLGGSDDFATPDAHVGCNSSLGETVDSDCINQPYIVILRQKFGIPGRSGNVPDLVLSAVSANGNEPATMTIPHGKAATFKHEPIVIRQQETFGEQVLVVGNDGQVTKIVSGMAAKAKKRGGRVIDRDTGLELDIPASVAASPREFHNEYNVDFSIDLTSLHREIVKIAFGFAHLTLGWRWTASAYSRKLRAIARGAGSRADLDAIITPVDPEIRTALPMGQAGPDDHFVALLPMVADTRIIVSLFSHAPLSAGVRLPIDSDLIEAGVAEHNRALATVDHQSRRTTWTSFVNFSDHLRRSTGGAGYL
ncbi:HNH endonuclease [Sphingomonas oryzagri]|uniref:HNH endonuclease n=1 Tax=Sphingomonas oryzagri TaxID=3042314 RepID=A0ABT6N570_9SPHN|nr:HNH endonuclease [Sphingomonas oryzagri]MDH7640254.1 HNH endonuclease [Sphingomonas oryzagri]